MRQDYIEFPRTFKLVLLTNNRPVVNEDGEAAWRRIRLIPFDMTIPPEERDALLTEKLKAEWPGILAWLVRGCLDWQREGLGEPEAVRAATASYRNESDLLGQFFEEVCELGDLASHWTPAVTLRHEFEKWCNERGVPPFAGKTLAEKLRSRGCVAKKKKGTRLVGREDRTMNGLFDSKNAVCRTQKTEWHELPYKRLIYPRVENYRAKRAILSHVSFHWLARSLAMKRGRKNGEEAHR